MLCLFLDLVAPVRERGLKFAGTFAITPFLAVAPVRERGLKYALIGYTAVDNAVAPVRERGLKLLLVIPLGLLIVSLP